MLLRWLSLLVQVIQAGRTIRYPGLYVKLYLLARLLRRQLEKRNVFLRQESIQRSVLQSMRCYPQHAFLQSKLALRLLDLAQKSSMNIVLQTHNLRSLLNQRRSSEKRNIFSKTLLNSFTSQQLILSIYLPG